jgi:hypothetical protein
LRQAYDYWQDQPGSINMCVKKNISDASALQSASLSYMVFVHEHHHSVTISIPQKPKERERENEERNKMNDIMVLKLSYKTLYMSHIHFSPLGQTCVFLVNLSIH